VVCCGERALGEHCNVELTHHACKPAITGNNSERKTLDASQEHPSMLRMP
jgi:hypothetical protein